MDDPFRDYDQQLPDDVEPADFAYCARMPNWNRVEALALALGADPKSLEAYLRKQEDAPSQGHRHHHPVVDLFRQLVDFSKRQFPTERAFFQDQTIVQAVERFNAPEIDWQRIAQAAESAAAEAFARTHEFEKAIADGAVNSSAAVHERDTLLRLFIGMAIEQYGFDPGKARNEAANQTTSDLALVGLSASDDTVRKYLRKGSELLHPETEWPPSLTEFGLS